jgi:hypothetical protein
MIGWGRLVCEGHNKQSNTGHVFKEMAGKVEKIARAHELVMLVSTDVNKQGLSLVRSGPAGTDR